jgi:hypothetical protein
VARAENITYSPGLPEDARDQLDFVFASEGFADHVRVRALNEVAEWGPRDHCRIEREVG